VPANDAFERPYDISPRIFREVHAKLACREDSRRQRANLSAATASPMERLRDKPIRTIDALWCAIDDICNLFSSDECRDYFHRRIKDSLERATL
jgi:hypothetical protein